MRLEADVKREARRIIANHGAYHFMPTTGGFGKSGLFDEVVCIAGHFLGIEYKRDGDHNPTALQDDNAKECVGSGGTVLLIHKDNLQKLDDTLQRLKSSPAQKPGVDNYWPEVSVKVVGGTIRA